MDYIELPDQLGGANYVTLRIPRDSQLPTIDGQWRRMEDGTIEASYTRHQLIEAVRAGIEIKLGQAMVRLERGEQMITEAQQAGNDEEAQRLAMHYASVLGEVAHLYDVRAICRASLEQSKK